MIFDKPIQIIGICIILIVLAALISGIIILVAKLFGRIKVKTSNVEVSAGDDNSDSNSDNEIIKQTNCISLTVPDFWKAMDLSNTINKIKNSGHVVNLQMKRCKAKGSLITDVLTENYRNTLLKHKKDIKGYDVRNDDDFRSYQAVMIVLWYNMAQKFEEFFEDNGITDMSESEFVKYKQNKIQILMQKATHIIDSFYIGKGMDREELYNSNRAVFGNINEILNNVFDECRIIGIEKYKELNEAELELNKIINLIK